MKNIDKAVRLLFDEYMRDPSICLGPDGTYYLTGTTSGANSIRLWKSKDLKKWEPLKFEWRYDTYILTGSDHYEKKYTSWVATSKNIYGPYSARYPAIPYGGHNMYFKDKDGKWWSTIFGGPINEKPGILPVNIEPNGQISLREATRE